MMDTKNIYVVLEGAHTVCYSLRADVKSVSTWCGNWIWCSLGKESFSSSASTNK